MDVLCDNLYISSYRRMNSFLFFSWLECVQESRKWRFKISIWQRTTKTTHFNMQPSNRKYHSFWQCTQISDNRKYHSFWQCHQRPAIQANVSTFAAVPSIIIICDILQKKTKTKRVTNVKKATATKCFTWKLKLQNLTISKINSLSTGLNTLLSPWADWTSKKEICPNTLGTEV